MKAITKDKYGGPEVLRLTDTLKPTIKNDHLLIKIKANSANPADWHILRGEPFIARFTNGLFKPKNKILGADFAGIVEEVGQNLTQFKKGDHVFGGTLQDGAFAEFANMPANSCAAIPEGIDFQTMACAPIAGITALQALTTHGKLKEGQSVLINGSSGGVGHFAVQIAKAQGAKVTAVCSSKNTDFVKKLGADKVVAYDKDGIHNHQEKYDLILDTNGNLSIQDYKRMGQRGLVTGFTTMGHMFGLLIKAGFSKYPLSQFTVNVNTKDLDTLANLIQSKKVKVRIEKTYTYDKIPEAISHIEAMRTRGKVAMVW